MTAPKDRERKYSAPQVDVFWSNKNKIEISKSPGLLSEIEDISSPDKDTVSVMSKPALETEEIPLDSKRQLLDKQDEIETKPKILGQNTPNF